ncbi:MAG: mechanosensitive ion channel family protein, partial [Hungatella sp.]|nr:mechanosensitive ion channel family protein [Hungatella sp.]
LANFAGGVLILLMKPFRVGDYIVSKDGEGTVRTIGLVYTVLNTGDNKQVVIPNGTLSNSPLTNVTAMDKRRLDVLVGIGYHSDLKKAKEILENIFRSQNGILKEEPIEIFVSDLTENAVTIGGRGWTSLDDYWPARWEILEKVKLGFEEAGIEIPYSRMEVQMEERHP